MRLWLVFVSMIYPLQAHAGPSLPNDCWSGVMLPENGPHGQLVARGPIAQWRVGVPVVFYPTKESFEQINELMQKGLTPSYDTSRPIEIIPTWIAGPEPSDKASKEDQSIQIMMRYRTSQHETGIISLTFWTPKSNGTSELPLDQQAVFEHVDWLSHDTTCRGIP